MMFAREIASALVRRDLQAAALGLALAAALCSPASAQTPPPNHAAQTQAAPKKKNPSERIICVDEETIGTRLGTHRVCHTKSEWDQISHDAGDWVNSAQGRAPGGSGK